MALKEYLGSIINPNDKNSRKTLEVAAQFLAEYGREVIDTPEKREEYFRVYYDMIPLEESLQNAREGANEARRQSVELRPRLNKASCEERNQLRQQISQAHRDYAHFNNEIRRITTFIRNKNIEQDNDLQQDWRNLVLLRGLRSIRYEVSDAEKLYPILLFRVYYPYEGKIYDLGDVEVRFNPDFDIGSADIAQRVRKTTPRSWGSRYPYYTYGDDSFCFGSLNAEIHDLIGERRFVEALIRMDHCFHSIREEHFKDIPNCFKEAEANDEAIGALNAYLTERGLI